jgi:hypothetical protein
MGRTVCTEPQCHHHHHHHNYWHHHQATSRYSDLLRASSPGGDEIFTARPDRPRGKPRYMCIGSFLGIKRPVRGAGTHLLLAPRLRVGNRCPFPPPLCLHWLVWSYLYPYIYQIIGRQFRVAGIPASFTEGLGLTSHSKIVVVVSPGIC